MGLIAGILLVIIGAVTSSFQQGVQRGLSHFTPLELARINQVTIIEGSPPLNDRCGQYNSETREIIIWTWPVAGCDPEESTAHEATHAATGLMDHSPLFLNYLFTHGGYVEVYDQNGRRLQ